MNEQNPFFHRGPVRDPDFFFGREEEVAQTCRLLQQGQHLSISGPRRFGKTSLLFHLAAPQVRAFYGLEKTEWVYLDGGTLDGLNDEWLYGAVNRALGGSQDIIPYSEFVGLLRGITAERSRLIIALDEFELLAANPQLGQVVFNRLRGLSSQFPIQFVTASKSPLAELSFAHSDTLSSPFFNIFAPMRLAAFTVAEAAELLVSLSERTGRRFSDESVNFIIDLVGCHPLFLQVAGYHSFAVLQARMPTPDDYEEIQRCVMADLDGHLQYYWGNLDEDARYILAGLSFFEIGSSTPARQKLEQSGLQPNGENFSQVVREFARSQDVPELLRVGSFNS